MVFGYCDAILEVGALSSRVEADKGCDHKGGRISISLQRGAKRACDICLPDNSEEEKIIYSGAYWCRKDDGNYIPSGESGRRRTGG